jgi:hypothetical protein
MGCSARAAAIDTVALAIAALLLLGCRKPEPASDPKPVTTTPSAAAAASPMPNVSPTQHVISAESAAALIGKWVAAQNQQSFGEYESLYAARFYGVKRAGEITTRFDRKGWLRDRKGMFARPFQVSVDALSIRVVAETVVAEFEQSFQSQRYADKGPKQLVMVVEDGALKIAREELFRSGRVADPAFTSRSADFSFIREIDERRYWVVHDASPEGQVIAAPPVRVGPAAAFAKLSDKSTLPKQVQALIGAAIAVEPGMQPSCTAKLGEWGVLAELEPHFETRRRWDGPADDALTQAQVAREIFGPDTVSGRDHHFAVDVTDATKGCASARWGRLQSLGDVERIALEKLDDPDSALLEALQRSLRKTRGYKDLERSFREAEPEGSFEEILAEALTLYRVQLGATSFMLTTFIHLGDCHGFSGELTQVWRIRGQTPVELQSVLPFAIRPDFALDLNKDGLPEWVSETQLIAWDGREYSTAIDVTPHDYDCPC